jgi:hypothetical protein
MHGTTTRVRPRERTEETRTEKTSGSCAYCGDRADGVDARERVSVCEECANTPIAVPDGGQQVEEDLTGFRAVCKECDWQGACFRERAGLARNDRDIHNDKANHTSVGAKVEEFPATRNAAGHIKEVSPDGE